MPVGKARAATVDSAGHDFRFIVPSFTTIDRAIINDHLQRDQFFWLDLTAPSREQLEELHELFGFHPGPRAWADSADPGNHTRSRIGLTGLERHRWGSGQRLV